MHQGQCSRISLLERGTLKHHLNSIMRRQVNGEMAATAPTAQDHAYCDSIAIDAYCSSGIGQKTVDTSLSCGKSVEDVRSFSTQCARSENGTFCGSLSSLHAVSQQYLEANCSGAITSIICPSQCRTHLEYLKSIFGCCINAHLNTSLYYSYNGYSLWNLCEVSPPATDCQNHALTFDVPASTQNCTNDEFTNLRLTATCEPNVAQMYINSLLKDNRCSQINLNLAKNFCSMNTRGEFCYQLIEHGGPFSVSTLNSSCDYEIGNATDEQDFECRSTCRNKLVEVKNAQGCCVNYYNRSISNPPPSLAYEIWETCGVETPGFCESKLSLNGSASTTYLLQWAFMCTWAVFAMFSIFNLGP